MKDLSNYRCGLFIHKGSVLGTLAEKKHPASN